MARIRAVRSGFSLIELLFVLAMITVILSLMLPAIQSSREAARRCACENNLRQLMLGLHNYEISLGSLPPGSINRGRPVSERSGDLNLGWLTQMLPFLEQQGLYSVFNSTVPVDDPANSTVAHTTINTLLCPSNPHSVSWPGVGISHYAGCHHDVESAIDIDQHGVMFLNSSIRHDDVFDGSSNTIFVGETRTRLPDGASQTRTAVSGWMSGTRVTLRNTGTAINGTPAIGDGAVGGFGGYHRDGVNFGFGDGSVRFVSERIDPAVLRLLGNRDDGELIDPDSLHP